MIRYFYTLLLTLAIGASCSAQNVRIIGAQPKADAEKSFGVTLNSTSSSVADDNTSDLQNSLDAYATNFKYPWFFGGGNTSLQGTSTSHTVVVPAVSGLRMSGTGFSHGRGSTDLTALGSFWRLRAFSELTTFDGLTNTLSTASGSPTTTVTVTGRPTVAEDVWNSVYISGGTNVVPGWYGIVSVTPGDSGTGTWTLDRNWNSGAVTGGTGSYCPETIRNDGYGTIHDAIHWTARLLTGGDDAGFFGNVCYHVATEQISDTSSGKHRWYDCSWAYYKVGVLFGSHAAGLGLGSTETGHAAHTDGHADECSFTNCWWIECTDCVACTNEQALGFVFTHPKAEFSSSFLNLQTGGRAAIYHLDFAGASSYTSQCIVRLGPDCTFGGGSVNIHSAQADPNNTRNPQIVATEWGGLDRHMVVSCRDSFIARNSTNDARTVFDGTTNKLTTLSASPTTVVTVTGRSTVASDKGKWVVIGNNDANATPGTYTITAVTPGASGSGTWTLNTNWNTGAVSNGDGSYDAFPVVDVQSLAVVLIDDTIFYEGSNAGWDANTIRMRGGATPASYQPWVTLENQRIRSTITDITDLLTPDSNNGYLIVRNCMTYGDGAAKFTDGVYDVGAGVWLTNTDLPNDDRTWDSP